MNNFSKARKVICSCKTYEQLDVAMKYIKLMKILLAKKLYSELLNAEI